jgi:hypothetical protein
MANLCDLLSKILCGGLYYGTVLCQRDTMQIWWSPFEWNSPSDGLSAQPEKWLCLGQSDWWANAEQKQMYLGLIVELGDDMPDWPGQWVYFDNRPHLTQHAPDKSGLAPALAETVKEVLSPVESVPFQPLLPVM